MPVLLLNGMVLVTTARSLIRPAMRWICSGVSNITPAGAAVKVVSVGADEWHSIQRRMITARASVKATGALPAAAPELVLARVISSVTIAIVSSVVAVAKRSQPP